MIFLFDFDFIISFDLMISNVKITFYFHSLVIFLFNSNSFASFLTFSIIS